MDPCRSNIGGGPDPCNPCGVDAYDLGRSPAAAAGSLQGQGRPPAVVYRLQWCRLRPMSWIIQKWAKKLRI